MPARDYHGWRGPGGAVYIAVDRVTGSPMLYSMDSQGDYEPVAEFVDHDAAEKLQQWMDDTITASGEANAILLTQLEAAQDDPRLWPL